MSSETTQASVERISGSDWSLVTTNDGKKYYFNTVTQVCLLSYCSEEALPTVAFFGSPQRQLSRRCCGDSWRRQLAVCLN